METKRVSVKRPIGSRARPACLPVVVAAIALPLLAGCSSSSTVEYATDAYPSQSLVDLLKRPKESSPPAPSAEFPPAAAAAPSPPLPASAAPPAREPPPVAATAAASPPAAATPPEEADPVAAAYPSVSLIDLLTGARKPAP
jgi:hypothetical protein